MISRGSQWKRWEPHIHAPGTILNNQFGGGDSWDAYLTTLETLIPKVEAIAITDYYVTDTYEEILKHKDEGRLPEVQLIFPNIELRLDVAAKSGFVNIHLLVSPEDPDHLNQLRRILTRLQFHAHGDRFDCTKNDLIALGRKVDPSIVDDRSALQIGATQFKVNFSQLREVIQESEWAKRNIIIAVAGGSGDGTSGIRQAADKTMREEIEKFSHIIFSSNAGQREFWLEQRNVSEEVLRDRYNGCKPCLHGSDSHDLKAVGNPVDGRFSWIKGGLEFDALRQACIDPGGRAYIGSEPPLSAMPSQVISHVSVSGASWACTPDIPLNPGLIAIIGARGSGKTALADMIAAGCDAIAPNVWRASENNSSSFLVRARPMLDDSTVKLTWENGSFVTRELGGIAGDNSFSAPQARYLSQQFVEELCSSHGASDGLIEEIERVILDSHPIDEREGAYNFDEFREKQTNRFQQARVREAAAISDLSERVALEQEKENLVASLALQVSQKSALIKNYSNDLTKLVVKGAEAQIRRHTELGVVAQALRAKVQAFTSQRRTFQALQDEVASTRKTGAPELLRQARERHRNSGLNDSQWDEFLLIYKGKVDESLSGYITWAENKIKELVGDPVQVDDTKGPFIGENVDLKGLSLSLINAEMARLEGLVSADKLTRDQYAALTKRIDQEKVALKALEEKLSDAQGASARKKLLQEERDNAYERVFDAIIGEQNILAGLYAPLMSRLAASSGTLSKLGFSVRRIADVRRWGAFAEENLFDRRKAGPLYGIGTFTMLAERLLKQAWESGSAIEIRAAMTDFISSYRKDLFAHAPVSDSEQIAFRAWSKKFAHWLFGTEHISVQYEILYDGIDIRKLSPGTRGIVLLLLYLALDESDDRPLIIDQPEENLDPKSVFEELVSLFIEAKTKRQVIIVTHNANLVINTDADQIIVAEAGPHHIGGLPPISYRAGGLENVEIRKAVCDILEGGEDAFRERARRLRVRLER